MRQVLISDVNRRLKSLSVINSASKNNMLSERARMNIDTKRVSDIKRYIETAGMNNINVSFSTVLDLFDTLAENGTVSDISKYGQYITENITHKVRDAKQTKSLLRRRLTRLQHKLASPTTNTFNDNAKNKAIQTAYESMLEATIIYINCDRMLENYNRISKRFNLETVINENTKINGVYDTVIELCNRIDTYDMPVAVKFNTVIETAFYGFESNFIAYEKSDILDAACNYFAFKENGIKSCKEILDATLFYNKDEDMGNIDVLTEDEPEENNSDTSSVDAMIRSRLVKGPEMPIIATESTEFSEIFEKFKKEELSQDKPESKLKSLIAKLYSRNVDSIVEETPDLLKWIRSFFIIGSCAVPFIGPVIMAISFIADRFISLHMDIDQTKKMVAAFNNEINKAMSKLESTSDTEEKEKLKKYIKSLEDAREKIMIYQMELSDDITMNDEYAKYEPIKSVSDEDDDMGLDGFDIDFDDDMEFTISEMANISEAIADQSSTFTVSENFMYLIPSKIDNDVITSLAESIRYFPEVFHLESFVDGLNSEYKKTKKDNSIGAYERHIRAHTIESAIEIANEKCAIDLEDTTTVFNANNNLSAIREIYEALNILNNISEDQYKENILEASFGNSLKLASMKLKNAFKKLSDKDRAISKNVDVSLNNFKKSVERSLTNDNREAIIKGSILPSASKIIKLAIINAGLGILIHPALAVIGTLGYLGCSAKYKHKERQMLIDEIEIEIKMCDKYIEIAEQKNDMKALKQLLMTKRDLERQNQRIKYKMRVELGQKYYDAKHVGDQ